MNPFDWIKLAIGAMKIVNWIMRFIDQKTWEASGRRQEMLKELGLANESVGFAEQAMADAKTMTPEAKKKRLGDDI